MTTLFKNLRAWRLDAPWTMPGDDLEAAVQREAFEPCAPAQAETLGWEEPIEDAGLVREIAGATILRARLQERVLPQAAVQEALVDRVRELEAREGGPIRGARRRELADIVRAEMLPRAALQSKRYWLAIHNGLVLVDSATPATGEALLSLLRGSIGNLGVRPLAFTRPIDGSLTAWLRSGDLPAGFRLGEWADLQHPQDTANKVRFRGQPLDEDEVGATLDRGLRVTALELMWDAGVEEPLRFVLGEDGSFKRVRIPYSEPPEGADESEAARLDADLAVTLLSLNRMFTALFPALGGVASE